MNILCNKIKSKQKMKKSSKHDENFCNVSAKESKAVSLINAWKNFLVLKRQPCKKNGKRI